MSRLGIVIPYRNRSEQLDKFIKLFRDKYPKNKLTYEFIVVEQVTDKPFNRGKLLNIGYELAMQNMCTYIAAQDVDMHPQDVDYSEPEVVTHLIDKLITPLGFRRDNFDEYIGGVTLIPSDVFKRVNGYPNDYWGWGFEDDNFLLRLDRTGEEVQYKIVDQYEYEGNAIRIEPTSYIRIPNVLDTKNDLTINVKFSINNMVTDPTEITDIQSIFSVPGFDFTLQYDSFQHFSLQFWDSYLNNLAITSKRHYPDGTYDALVKILNKSQKMEFYLNGELIGEQKFDKLDSLRRKKFIYLGAGDPTRDHKQNWLDGSIISFSISKNDTLIADYTAEDGFTQDHSVKSGNPTHHKTKIVNHKSSDKKLVAIPHRRKGVFDALKHEENGYTDGYWKEWGSRENQIHYYSCKYDSRPFYWYDGLSRLKYEVLEQSHDDNYHHYKVEL